MRDIVARITDCVVELNSMSETVSNNETVEFDVDKRLDVLEVVIDDLTTSVEDSVEASVDMSEA